MIILVGSARDELVAKLAEELAWWPNWKLTVGGERPRDLFF